MGPEDPLEDSVATHSSILAWRIPWTEELVGSTGSQRDAHEWKLSMHTTENLACTHEGDGYPCNTVFYILFWLMGERRAILDTSCWPAPIVTVFTQQARDVEFSQTPSMSIPIILGYPWNREVTWGEAALFRWEQVLETQMRTVGLQHFQQMRKWIFFQIECGIPQYPLHWLFLIESDGIW